MKPHLRIAQNGYRSPGLAWELISQKMIDRRAGFSFDEALEMPEMPP